MNIHDLHAQISPSWPQLESYMNGVEIGPERSDESIAPLGGDGLRQRFTKMLGNKWWEMAITGRFENGDWWLHNDG